jgi:hypothetical protein
MAPKDEAAAHRSEKAAALAERFDGDKSPWTVEISDDPNFVGVIDELTGELVDKNFVNPGVLTVTRGAEELKFSPSYNPDELQQYLVEHDLISAHENGEHPDAVGDCPECWRRRNENV